MQEHHLLLLQEDVLLLNEDLLILQEEGFIFQVSCLGGQQTNTSYIPSSESINNLSSKVKTKLTGALGYIAGSSSSVGDLSEVISDRSTDVD